MDRTKAKNIGIAFVRTSLVPPLAGALAAFLVVQFGLEINENWVLVAVSFVCSALYYLLFHGLEVLSKNPKVVKWAGIALGWNKQPHYEEPELVTEMDPPVGLEGV